MYLIYDSERQDDEDVEEAQGGRKKKSTIDLKCSARGRSNNVSTTSDLQRSLARHINGSNQQLD